jgi:hypothetical protein
MGQQIAQPKPATTDHWDTLLWRQTNPTKRTPRPLTSYSSLSVSEWLLLAGAIDSCSPAMLHTSVPASVSVPHMGAAMSPAAACSCSAMADPTVRDRPVPGLLLVVLLSPARADGGVPKPPPMPSLAAGESHRLFSISQRSAAALASAVTRPAWSFQ